MVTPEVKNYHSVCCGSERKILYYKAANPVSVVLVLLNCLKIFSLSSDVIGNLRKQLK